MDVNVKGVANVIRAFVPAMVAKKRGVIVNLSSGWGRSTAAEVAPYCATKYAIEGLTLSLAQELPRRDGSSSAEPRHHRYRHAARSVSRGREQFPEGRRLGTASRPISAQPERER